MVNLYTNLFILCLRLVVVSTFRIKQTFLIDLLLLLQPVVFVTFDCRSGAEAAKNALNVSTWSSVSNVLIIDLSDVMH